MLMQIWNNEVCSGMGTILLSAMAVAFSGAVMPGPLLTYTIQQSLANGPKAGPIIILGHAVLECLVIALIFMGFSIILQSVAAQIAISLIGGAWLAWMGIGMLRDALQNRLQMAADCKTTSGSMVLSGFVISAMNPYFLIWWAVIGLGFLLEAYKAFGLWGVVVYYIGHVAVDLFWYGFISTLVGKTRRFISEKPYRIIVGALGVLLVYFGASFVLSAVKLLS